jgi:PPOX class probable F420-dependent enzyme
MSLTMTVAEREAFLAAPHVGVLAVADSGARPPLMVPVWYTYEPAGELSLITGRGSRKVALIEREKRFSVCVQTEEPPYRYVTVEGPLRIIEDPTSEEERRAMADRYLGREEGGRYVASTPDEARDSITIRMRPERWLTADFGKQQR